MALHFPLKCQNILEIQNFVVYNNSVYSLICMVRFHF